MIGKINYNIHLDVSYCDVKKIVSTKTDWFMSYLEVMFKYRIGSIDRFLSSIDPSIHERVLYEDYRGIQLVSQKSFFKNIYLHFLFYNIRNNKKFNIKSPMRCFDINNTEFANYLAEYVIDEFMIDYYEILYSDNIHIESHSLFNKTSKVDDLILEICIDKLINTLSKIRFNTLFLKYRMNHEYIEEDVIKTLIASRLAVTILEVYDDTIDNINAPTVGKTYTLDKMEYAVVIQQIKKIISGHIR